MLNTAQIMEEQISEHSKKNGVVTVQVELGMEASVDLSYELLDDINQGMITFDDLDKFYMDLSIGNCICYLMLNGEPFDITSKVGDAEFIKRVSSMFTLEEAQKLSVKDKSKVYRVLKTGNKVFYDAAVEAEHLQNYYTTRDTKYRDIIVECNLGLVQSIVQKYIAAGYAYYAEDLIQVGNIGLLQAVEDYNPTMGVKFSTYATPKIAQTIKREIYTNTKPIRNPEYIEQMVYKIKRAKQELERSNKNLTPSEQTDYIKEKLGISDSEWKYAQMAIVQENMLNLDEPMQGESTNDTRTLNDIVEDTTASDFYRLSGMYRDEIVEVLMEAVEKGGLKEKYLAALLKRIGWDDGEEHTLEEIGKEMGVTKTSVNIWIKSAISILQQPQYGNRIKEILTNA